MSRRGLISLVCAFLLVCLPAAAQKLIGSVPVGNGPGGIAINRVTNKLWVTNVCGGGACEGEGSVTEVDESTLATTTVQTPRLTGPIALNTVTNQVYVITCLRFSDCFDGTVTVIDGATLSTTVVPVGNDPTAIAVNENTNKIYVANSCTPQGCGDGWGDTSLTVIDGATLATTTILLKLNFYGVGSALAVNPVTNKIYVTNSCGTDPDCGQPGTLTVIDAPLWRQPRSRSTGCPTLSPWTPPGTRFT